MGVLSIVHISGHGTFAPRFMGPTGEYVVLEAYSTLYVLSQTHLLFLPLQGVAVYAPEGYASRRQARACR